MHRALLIAGLAVLLLPLPARAASAREVFERHGLMGTWAIDCARPASLGNPFVTYHTAGSDGVERLAATGPSDLTDVSVVDSVVDLGPTELTVHWRSGNPGRDSTNRLVVKDDLIQVVDSMLDIGIKMVENGQLTGDHSPMPPYRRCNTNPTVDLTPARSAFAAGHRRPPSRRGRCSNPAGSPHRPRRPIGFSRAARRGRTYSVATVCVGQKTCNLAILEDPSII
jgi:hypothetical protein